MANRQPSGKTSVLDKDDGGRLAAKGSHGEDSAKTSTILPPPNFAPAAIKTESADSGGAKERR